MSNAVDSDARSSERTATLAAKLLTDVKVLPSVTSVRFAVLVLMLVASTGSIYGAIGLLVVPGLDQKASRCTTGVAHTVSQSLLAAHKGALGALQCELPYTGSIVVWSLSGVAILALATAAFYVLTPRWMIRMTRPWLPVGRRDDGTLGRRRPWWIHGPQQRLQPLRGDRGDQVMVEERIRELAARSGLTAVPQVGFNPYARDTGARTFNYQRRGYLRLNGGLLRLLRDDRTAFDGIVLHEFGHLHNRDLRPAYVTYAAWRAFLLAALVPYTVALTFPNLLDRPLSSHAFSLRAPTISSHLLGSIVILIVLAYLTRNAVLRVRESHADARAWLVDSGAVLAAFKHHRKHAQSRARRPAFLSVHPTPERRLRDLGDRTALARPEGLAMFAAGIATALTASNVQWITWFLALSPSSPTGRTVSHLVSQLPLTRAWSGLLLQVIMDGPTLALIAALLAGFACTTMWRAQIGAATSGVGVRAARHALPWALGYLVGEPMSVIDAMSGFWGVLDISPAWVALDLAVSALILTMIVMLSFRWAAESAAAWIPVTAGSLRRRCALTAVLGALGAGPALFPWLLYHNTQMITQVADIVVTAPIAGWPLVSLMLTQYAPPSQMQALPGGILLIALPALFALAGTTRHSSNATPRWLAGQPPEAMAMLRRVHPQAWARTALRSGCVLGVASAVLSLCFALVLREVVGAPGMRTDRLAGGDTYLLDSVSWITALTCGIAAVAVGRKNRQSALSATLATAFVATAVAVPLLTATVFVGACGQGAWGCFSARAHAGYITYDMPGTHAGYIVYGMIGTSLPLYGAFVAIIAYAVSQIIAYAVNRRRPTAPRVPREPTTPPSNGMRSVAVMVTIILAGAAASTYFATRYLLIGALVQLH